MILAAGAPKLGAADILRAIAPLALLSLAAVTLLYLQPAQHSFYPQCPIYNSLHLLCPGCGTTRALAALLRGHIAEAMRFNVLATLMTPIAAAYVVGSYRRFVRREPVPLPHLPTAAIYCGLLLAAAFTVLRNLSL